MKENEITALTVQAGVKKKESTPVKMQAGLSGIKSLCYKHASGKYDGPGLKAGVEICER